jgi:hypothetical protein
MADVSPEDLGSMAEGAKIAGLLPYLNSELEKMQLTVLTRVFGMVGQQTLTPELAYAAFLELYAYNRLRKRFDTTVRIGQSAGARIKQGMESQTGEPQWP